MGQLELVADVLLVYWLTSIGWLLLTATVYRVQNKVYVFYRVELLIGQIFNSGQTLKLQVFGNLS
jgi:hypothetical protein